MAALGGILSAPKLAGIIASIHVVKSVEELQNVSERAMHLISYPLWHRRDALELLVDLKEKRPGDRIVAGGPGPGCDPEAAISDGFDHVFIGPAEGSLPEFLLMMQRSEPVPDIVKSHPPDASLFNRFDGIAPQLNLFAPLEISRGCFCRCGFCGVPTFAGNRVIHRSPESAERICRIAAAHGRRRSWVISPNALAYGMTQGGRHPDLDAIEQLLQAMKRGGIEEIFFGSFPSEISPELATRDALGLLRRYCSNRLLTIGGQSGSATVLKIMGRAHSVEDVLNACSNAVSNEFIPHVDILYGSPGETCHDRELTREMILRILDDHGGRVHLHYFMPLPGSPWADCQPEPLDDSAMSFIHEVLRTGRADGYVIRQVAAGTNGHKA